MSTQLILVPTTIVGYHGCSEESAVSILDSGSFRLSRKEYDWLGEGFYFFEYAPNRAWEWAQAVVRREGGSPAILEATIELRRCVNLLDTVHVDSLPPIHELVRERYTATGARLPRNTDTGAHFLDQEVINLYCAVVDRTSKPYQTIRGCFPEGAPVYPGSKILRRTHVQIAVRDPDCIRDARIVTSLLEDER